MSGGEQLGKRSEYRTEPVRVDVLDPDPGIEIAMHHCSPLRRDLRHLVESYHSPELSRSQEFLRMIDVFST